MIFRWGAKGFSLNVDLGDDVINLFFGYSPASVFKQSIYTGFEVISRKVDNAQDIIEFYRKELENLGYFTKAGSNLKWVINSPYSEDEVNRFLEVIEKVINLIKKKQ